jgi:hypothetical protein
MGFGHVFWPFFIPPSYRSLAANFHFSRVALARVLILEISPPSKNIAAPCLM